MRRLRRTGRLFKTITHLKLLTSIEIYLEALVQRELEAVMKSVAEGAKIRVLNVTLIGIPARIRRA